MGASGLILGQRGRDRGRNHKNAVFEMANQTLQNRQQHNHGSGRTRTAAESWADVGQKGKRDAAQPTTTRHPMHTHILSSCASKKRTVISCPSVKKQRAVGGGKHLQNMWALKTTINSVLDRVPLEFRRRGPSIPFGKGNFSCGGGGFEPTAQQPHPSRYVSDHTNRDHEKPGKRRSDRLPVLTQGRAIARAVHLTNDVCWRLCCVAHSPRFVHTSLTISHRQTTPTNRAPTTSQRPGGMPSSDTFFSIQEATNVGSFCDRFVKELMTVLLSISFPTRRLGTSPLSYHEYQPAEAEVHVLCRI